jgi:hypothetical protein
VKNTKGAGKGGTMPDNVDSPGFRLIAFQYLLVKKRNQGRGKGGTMADNVDSPSFRFIAFNTCW